MAALGDRSCTYAATFNVRLGNDQRQQAGALLNELLGSAVQQPNVRVGGSDRLSLELEHQSKHTVRRGVLRPKVKRQVGQIHVRNKICQGQDSISCDR